VRLCRSLLAAALAGCSSPPPAPEDAADADFSTIAGSFATFKEALARGDDATAYEALSSDTRERYPKALFVLAFTMTATGQRYRTLFADAALVTHIEKSDGRSAVAVLRGRDATTGAYEMRSVRLVKEGDRWLVQFTLQEFFGIPEERFFDLREVATRRDFRHRR
jgi:hypothetical protein